MASLVSELHCTKGFCNLDPIGHSVQILNLDCRIQIVKSNSNIFRNFCLFVTYKYLTRICNKGLLCLELVDSIVELAFSSPECPVEDRSEEIERDRVACSASIVHQVRDHFLS